MRIDFILDIGCLWSFIAWRQLTAAMDEFGRDVEVTPFFVTSSPLFAGFGIEAADKARLFEDRAKPFLESLNISVPFDALPDFGDDTAPACRLVRHAFACKKGKAVLSDVFNAFFINAEDITDTGVLTEIARQNGLSDAFLTQADPLPLPSLLRRETFKTFPCLIFDRKSIIFGAQSVACFKQMLALSACLQNETAFDLEN